MMAYIEIPPIIVSALGWVAWMLWGSFLFLYNIDGETVSNAMLAAGGIACLFMGTVFALFWINWRYGLVAVKA